MYYDDLNRGIRGNGDIRETPLKPRGSARRSSAALGKNQQIFAGGQRFRAPVQDFIRRKIVTDIPGGGDYPAEEDIAPKLVLDHALHLRDDGYQDDHVEQCRVVGDDHPAAACRELFPAVEFKLGQAEHVEKPHE